MFSLVPGAKEEKNHLELQAVSWQLFFRTGSCSLSSVLHTCTEQDIFLNMHLDMQHYAFAIPVLMLRKLSMWRKSSFSHTCFWSVGNLPATSMDLSVHTKWSSFTEFCPEVIFIVLVTFPNWKKVILFLHGFLIKNTLSRYEIWTILYFSFEKGM